MSRRQVIDDMPQRIFLDTCVVNFLLDYSGQVFDGEEWPKNCTEWIAQDIDALKSFLKEKAHPVVAKWAAEAAPTAEATPVEAKMEEGAMMPVMTASTLPIMAGGFKIILKDAKIYANKVIIKTVKDEKSEKR